MLFDKIGRGTRDSFCDIQEAFRYDRKILIEEAIVGREIECSVLGNEKPQASLPGTDIELIRVEDINHTLERLEKGEDVKYRFVIDMKTL